MFKAFQLHAVLINYFCVTLGTKGCDINSQIWVAQHACKQEIINKTTCILIVTLFLFQLPKGRSVCCDLSLRGPKHAQQRTTPQDRGVLLVSREEGQGLQSYLDCNSHTYTSCLFLHPINPPCSLSLLIHWKLKKFDAFQGRYSLPIHWATLDPSFNC